MPKLQEKPSSVLKREHPALQNMKFLNFFYFCGSFLLSWIRIRNTASSLSTDIKQLNVYNTVAPLSSLQAGTVAGGIPVG